MHLPHEQMASKQQSLGLRGGSFESGDSQQHLRTSLRKSASISDGQTRRQLHSAQPSLGEESGSQLAARLNSSTFGTEEVSLSGLTQC